MYSVGDHIVYRKEVCQIVEIKKNQFRDKDYYRLAPLGDPSLTIDVPVDGPSRLIRSIISKEEVEKLISKIPTIGLIETGEKMMENEYRRLLASDQLEDIIKVIKTTYVRNQTREANKKKISDKDDAYLKKAEQYLYQEFAIVLNKSVEETKDYVITQVTKLENPQI